MKDKLEQLFYFGLGTALMAKEKIEQAGESARSCSEEGDQRAREFFDQAVAKGGEEREQITGRIKELLKEIIDELGLATRADIEALRSELAHLRQDQP